MATDVFDLMDDAGPEKVVCGSDSSSGMRGVLVIDNPARGVGKGGARMSPCSPFVVDPDQILTMISAKRRTETEAVLDTTRAIA